MPAILDKLVDALVRQGKTKQQAMVIAKRQLQDSGILKRGTSELTDMGKSRIKAARKKFAKRK